MRDYGKVSTLFWTRGSGKRLRGDPEAQLVALYLVTNPWASSFGVYYLPIAVIANDTGSPFEGASEALARVIQAGFAKYDLASELVWVPNLPKLEIGSSLSGGDKRKKHLQEQLEKLGNHPFAVEFFDVYGADFGLTEPKPLRSPFEGPWEPLRSQKQKQKQDQKTKQDQIIAPVEFSEAAFLEFEHRGNVPLKKPKALPVADAPGLRELTDLWFAEYERFYKRKPTWGAVYASKLKQLIAQGNLEELRTLIPAFFAWKRPEVIRGGHSLWKGYASLIAKLDELRADLAAPERRAFAAIVDDVENQDNRRAQNSGQSQRVLASLAQEREHARLERTAATGHIGTSVTGNGDGQGYRSPLRYPQPEAVRRRPAPLDESADAFCDGQSDLESSGDSGE